MRIVHVANFYGARSGGLRTTMDELTRGYADHGHQPVLVVPGDGLTATSVDGVEFVTLPSRELPLTGGYRVITDRALLHRVLTALEPDVLEVSDRTTLIGLGRWARRRGIATVAFAHERLDRLIHQSASACRSPPCGGRTPGTGTWPAPSTRSSPPPPSPVRNSAGSRRRTPSRYRSGWT